MYADELLGPWLDEARALVPGVDLFDCHNHVGERDPSGFSATLTELETGLALAGGRSVVTPAADPAGYGEANKACAAAAAESAGRLVAFTRVRPDDRPGDMLAESLSAGARGVKLHGSSDDFGLDDPRLEEVYEIADAERLPVRVHAGPELDAVGGPPLEVCRRRPGLR